MLGRIYAVQAGTHHRDSWQAAVFDLQGAAMRCRVYAQRHARHDRQACVGQAARKSPGVVRALGCGVAAAHDGNALGLIQTLPGCIIPLDIQHQRRIIDVQ
jgi:hypothetical protein